MECFPVTIFYSSNLSRRALLMAGAGSAFALAPAVGQSATAKSELASGAMLAKPWLPALNPADFLVSEKLDGVRALWDGSSLRFRSGRLIAAPRWILTALPATALDGELWMGRHSFERLSGAVRKEVPVDTEWKEVRYMVFDAPRADERFAQRAQRVEALVATAQQPWLQAVVQSTVSNAAALQARLDEVIAAGGEGLVLHRASALWAPGRSDDVRKLKASPDEEGVVLAHVPGTGKYQGRMGALLLQTPEGKRFALGTGFSDAERASPPVVGSVVTYRYRDRTASGLPKFASFVRVRVAE